MEEADKYLSDIKREVKDIRQKLNIVFVEVLKRGSENAISASESHLAFSIGIASIGVALVAIGLTSKNVAFEYLGIAVVVVSTVFLRMLHRRISDLKKSLKMTGDLVETLVKETEESFKD